MPYLLIPLLSLCASAKVLIQSRFAKGHTKTAANALLYNGIVFLIVLLWTCPSLFQGGGFFFFLTAWLYGLFSVLFQFFYLQAFQRGSTPITVLIVSTAMIVSVVFSAIAYGESFGAQEIIGSILILVTFVLNAQSAKNEKEEKKSVTWQWLLCAVLAFIFNAAASIVQKIYTKNVSDPMASAFVSHAYLFAAVFSFLLYFCFRCKRDRAEEKFEKKALLSALGVGSALCAFQVVNVYATAMIDATVLQPAYNGGLAVFVTLFSVLLYKEKMTKLQWLSAGLSLFATILVVL